MTHSDIEESAAYWDQHNLAPTDDIRYWLAVPELRQDINQRLSGDPAVLFIARFLDGLPCPAERALSIGCGTGDLERGVANLQAAREVHGVDVSTASLDEARRLADESGLSERVQYFLENASTWLGRQPSASYGLVFFHGSLHHIEDLEGVLDGAARVLNGSEPGLLYVDEYIGPSRGEWSDQNLITARELFAQIPERFRRTPEVWPPIAMEDPTEMIRSSEIPTMLEERFEIIDRQLYGGQILSPLVSALRGSTLEHPAVAPILREALELEQRDIESSHYGIFTARPR
ncbi:MAG: class I SAM-dependent methyltransferase [Acidobacteriota bacterium]